MNCPENPHKNAKPGGVGGVGGVGGWGGSFRGSIN